MHTINVNLKQKRVNTYKFLKVTIENKEKTPEKIKRFFYFTN